MEDANIREELRKAIETNKERSRHYTENGRPDIALTYLHHNLGIAKFTGSPSELCHTYLTMASRYDDIFDYAQAIIYYKKVIEEYLHEIGDDLIEWTIRHRLASCYECIGDYKKALWELEIIEEMDRESGNSRSESITMAYKAALYIHMGDLKAAEVFLGKAKEACPERWNENYQEDTCKECNNMMNVNLKSEDGREGLEFYKRKGCDDEPDKSR